MKKVKGEYLDALCTCGHPSVCHCCVGSFSPDGKHCSLTTNAGNCLMCESLACEACDSKYGEDNGPCYHKQPCPYTTCEEFHYKADIRRGNEYHKQFKSLFDEMDEEDRLREKKDREEVRRAKKWLETH